MRRLLTNQDDAPARSTRLSSSVTVARYRALERQEDWEALASFIVERFEERYFKPIENSSTKHGFTILAVCCLVIETLESFYQGRADTKRKSAQMFRDFFKRNAPLRAFSGEDDWFFQSIRCGILHQGEVRNGWRILRNGPLLDTESKAINATRFLRELKKAVKDYGNLLKINDREYRSLFKKKMKAVCANCE